MVKKFSRFKSLFTYIMVMTTLLLGGVVYSPSYGFAQAGTSADFSAGVAKVSLSPTQSQLAGKKLYMGGYGGYMSRGPAEGVSNDGIYARALAVKSGQDSLVFLTIDTTVIGNVILDAIRQGASSQTGIPEDHIVISATHTHAGPDLNGLWGGVPADYKQLFIENSIKAVVKATNQMKHATIRKGSTTVPQELVKNRRGLGYTDHALGILQVQSGNKTLATLVNFAAHPVVLRDDNKLLSSDFVGSLEKEIESEYGGTAMFVNGAQGDVEPNVNWKVPVSEQYTLAKDYGQSLSKYVFEAIEKSKTVPPGIAFQTQNVTFPVENPSFIFAKNMGLFNGYAAMRQEGLQYFFDSKISRITLGKGKNAVEMVTLPGEAVTNLGLNIRDLMPGNHKLLLGLTHDTLGYLIPESEWSTTAYEETVSLGRKAGDIVRRTIEGLY
ncbi:neutral/alkaline non-lysosomal ceramidase N-terminal domain-containing protein [Bacillus sp. FJAT-29953]|nr:neutral/alkaline non-lysosomal ceramidase N-terminal domain-containing protein [Bacillus sp. FJAT-29953]